MAYRRQGDLQAGDVLTAEYLNQVNENTNQNHDDLEQYKLRVNDKFERIDERDERQSRDISAALFGLTDLDQKSSYHLGTYDNVVENADGTITITRQTGYVDVSKLILDNQDIGFFRNTPSGYEYDPLGLDVVYTENAYGSGYELTFKGNYNFESGDAYINQDKFILTQTWISLPNTYNTKDKYLEYFRNNHLIIQYKLATSYQEKVIPNRPINTLDQNGSQWVRDEWEKGLNLWSLGNIDINGSSNFPFTDLVKPNTTYTISSNATNGDWVVIIGNAQYGNVSVSTPITFTTPNSFNSVYFFFNMANTNVAFMLNEGDHAYPYQPYTANKHITNDEATLLKEEFEKSANLANVQDTNETIAGVNNTTTSQHIVIKGTATSDNAVFVRSNLTLLPIGTYTIKFFGQKLPSGCYVFDGTSPKFVSNGSSITIETGFGQNYFQFNTTIDSYYDLDFYIMFVKGSTAPTIYQPYNGEIVHKKELDDVQNNLNAFKQGMIIKESENYKVVFNEDYGFYITDKNDENDPRFFVGLNNYAMYMNVGNTEYNLMPKKTWSIKGYGTYGTEGSYPLELSQFFFTITVDANIRFSQDEVINRLKGTEIPVSGTRITYTSAQSTAEHVPALTFKVESDGTMHVSYERTSGYHELGQLWGRALTSITFTLLGEYK